MENLLDFRPYTDVIHVVILNMPTRRIGDLYREIDGFWVFEFAEDVKKNGGYFSEAFFAELAVKLKELNDPWRAQIEKDLV